MSSFTWLLILPLFENVSSELFIDVSPSEIVIALIEDKHLVELTREKKRRQVRSRRYLPRKSKEDNARPECCFC